MERYRTAYGYFSGDNLPPDNVDQPLHINYLGAINEKQNAYLWGQWEDQDLVTWRVRPLIAHGEESPDEEAQNKARIIQRWISDLFRLNDADVLLYEAGLNGSIYGDTFLKASWDNLTQSVRLESCLPEYLHCRWDPKDYRKITEVIIAYPIDRQDAFQQYGTSGNDKIYKNVFAPQLFLGCAIYWERWTPTTFEVWIDDTSVEQRPNPYIGLSDQGMVSPGAIPFVHIPNLRVGGEFYGFEDAYRGYELQDEINRGFADQADIVNNHAHPITLINNFYGDKDALPVGPDQVWDMGRDGIAKYLQWEGTPPMVMDYLMAIREMLFDTAAISQVSFGRHQGTQQSGLALTVEMAPTVDRAKWKRILWTIGLRQLVRLCALIQSRQGQLPFSLEDLNRVDLRPIFAPILPRDRMTAVNENVALVNNAIRSRRRAMEDLGIEEIDDDLQQIYEETERLAEAGFKKPGGGYGGGPGSRESVISPESARRGRPETA